MRNSRWRIYGIEIALADEIFSSLWCNGGIRVVGMCVVSLRSMLSSCGMLSQIDICPLKSNANYIRMQFNFDLPKNGLLSLHIDFDNAIMMRFIRKYSFECMQPYGPQSFIVPGWFVWWYGWMPPFHQHIQPCYCPEKTDLFDEISKCSSSIGYSDFFLLKMHAISKRLIKTYQVIEMHRYTRECTLYTVHSITIYH